jgi:hypothetical protein
MCPYFPKKPVSGQLPLCRLQGIRLRVKAGAHGGGNWGSSKPYSASACCSSAGEFGCCRLDSGYSRRVKFDEDKLLFKVVIVVVDLLWAVESEKISSVFLRFLKPWKRDLRSI